jgi:MFS family permease
MYKNMKKYLLGMICVYMCYLTHGIQAVIFTQNMALFAEKWGYDMSVVGSAAYTAGSAAVSAAVAWVGLGKFVSVWIGGEISDRVGRKKLMIGGAILYVLCFIGLFVTTSGTVAGALGFISGVATSGFWDGSGYPAVQEAYPKAPGAALILIKCFVSLSGMVYPLIVVATNNLAVNIMIPLVMSVACVVLAFAASFVYDDQKKAGAAGGGNADEVAAEIAAAKARMKMPSSMFTKFVVMFYAFLCMGVMYGAQQYIKRFGITNCGVSEMQAAGMSTVYTLGSIIAVLFWAVMMAKLNWNPIKVVLVDSVMTAVALLMVLFIHQVVIVYIAIAIVGFGAAGGALQTGLGVVQLFNPGPKGRNTGIYYTFMGIASYLVPVVASKLTIISGEAAAVYTLMLLMVVFAALEILSALYLVAQHKKIFGTNPLKNGV